CLKDLSYLPDDHQIIVVDNGSIDETKYELPKMLKLPEFRDKLIYQRNDENFGFAKACNIGYGLAVAPNILFLNNDIRVKNDHGTWTKVLLERCSEGLVGPTMGKLDEDLNFVREANQILEGNSYMSGWCLASSKQIGE